MGKNRYVYLLTFSIFACFYQKLQNKPNFPFKKNCQEFKNNHKGLIFDMQVTTIHILVFARFAANIHWIICKTCLENIRTWPNMAIFPTFKNSLKIKEQSQGGNFFNISKYYLNACLCKVWSWSVEPCAKYLLKTSAHGQIWLFF